MRALRLPAAMFVALAAGCSEPPAEPPATTLIGLDGADWRIALPLMRQGKLPVMAALRRAGASGVMLTNPDYRFSPVLWTSIATGMLPDKHGVESFMADVPGWSRRLPTPSTQRKCRALWNIFSERGRTVGFVGWWVTWPAEPVNGFLVTDHFSVSRFDLGDDYERTIDTKYRVSQTWPEELTEELLPLKVDRQMIDRRDFARFADLPDDYEFPESFTKFGKASEFAIAHSVDRTHDGVGRKLLEEQPPDLFAVFFQGIDIMQHFFWEFMDPRGTTTAPSDADRAAYGETIERYYAWMDGRVGAVVAAGRDGRAVLAVSDHGFVPSTDRYEKGISGEHRRQAFFLFAGPGVRRGVWIDDFDAIDVTPTLAAYHGLPVAEDLDGAPASAAITGDWAVAHAAEPVPTYEVGEWERGRLPDESVARDLEERIRALGYIE